jgi:2,3-diaminopropionate biosynthesis protein SbnB
MHSEWRGEWLVLRQAEVEALGCDWRVLRAIIAEVNACLRTGDAAQPIKPYLRYGDSRNRIIAMPAYVGGTVHRAGLKWIASFPGNRAHHLARAHSLTVLNDADTGVPLAVMDSAILSARRTAAVSACFLQQCEAWLSQPFRVGLIGCGPIGLIHLQMMKSLYGNRVHEYLVYDVQVEAGERFRQWAESEEISLKICTSWRAVYEQADVLMTCTAATERYIDILPPMSGKILLHVSLRDYKPHVMEQIPLVVVDRWEEVCREGTDIEVWQRQCAGVKERVQEWPGKMEGDLWQEFADERATVMFSPMGMAVYDIAVADYYYRLAQKH